jgi:hypothetical protein
MPRQRRQRGKYWCFTLNNPLPNEEELLGQLVEQGEHHVSYIGFGHESGDSGTPHLQGYLELTKKLSLRTVKSIPGLERAHLEKRRGTQAEAVTYCKKDASEDNPYTCYGELFKSNQGERSDLTAIRDALESGASMAAIAHEHFGDFVRYHKGFDAYARLLKRERRPPTVYCLWGVAGTGKTRVVFQREPDLFICPDSTLQWFDGYDGQSAVLIDDFRTTKFTGRMLQLLDRYPLRVPVKGGFVAWTPDRIYVTSNEPPPFCSGLDREREPLMRRFHKIIHLSEPLDFETLDIETFFN